MRKYFRKRIGRQAGFTLVELLVVVAIIGILAAIIIPAVGKYIASGSSAAAASELAITQNAVYACMADAKVAGWVGITGFNKSTTAANETMGIAPNQHKISDYFGNGLTGLKGTYNITSAGMVSQTAYVP